MSKKEKWETPLEKEQRENKLISFSERWEEELKEKLFNLDKSNEQEIHTVIQEPYEWHNPHPDQEWDVPITEEIKYFDPELSYELTGYRPITMEKGLDFEPDLFRERAITYERKHNYTEYPAGTKPYSDFWNEEYKRCQEGLTIGKYRLTGDHYFFLNYYRMFTVLEDSTAGSGRLENFPSFLSKQYEFFHYVEMAEKLGKDICILKARGIGLSEIVASLAVRPYTTNRGYHVMLTCAAETKLTPLKNKCWKQLDWLNMNTNGGFRHVRLVVNNNDTKRASIKTPDGIEYGWGSEITSVVADTSDKIRGDRLDRLIYEEAGSNKYLTESWIKGDALVALGGKHFGSRIALGCVCAGTKVWTKDGRHINIENLKKEDGIIGFHEGDYYPEDIISLQDPAEKECVRIITDFGILECSEDHPIFTRITHSHRIEKNSNKRIKFFNYEWMMAKDLEGISLHSVIGICDKIDIWGTETLFDPYLVGALIGDGSYGFDKTPRISNCDEEILDYITSRYNTCNDREPKLTKNNKIYKELRIKGITKNLRDCGIYGQTKTAKRLPRNYMNLTKQDVIQMLSGLFDTDGCITFHSNSYRICITQSSIELLEQIIELLNKLGIYGHIHKQEPRISPKRFDKNSYYTLYIEDTISLINFAEQIPLKVKYKQKRLENILSLKDTSVIWKHYYTYKGIREAHVIDVERIGTQTVYNLTAGGVNTYLANNFITHNTGGDDIALNGLSNMFAKPEAYNILPFKNYDTDDGKPELVSFFIPAHKFALTSEYLDKRGVTNHIEFKKFYIAQREKLTDKDFLNECAEHCFTPREALSKHGDNIFDSVVISERMIQIKVHGDYIKPKPMALFWDNASGVKKVRAAEHPDSKLLVVEPPVLDEQGQPFKNLYVAGIDAIDMGKAESATDYDVSDFCVVIKKRQFGQNPPKYVAIYKDRPNNIREAFEITMRLLVWYNCKALLEQTKFSIQTYFKEHNMGHYFMPRPKVALAGGIRNPKKQLMGLQATPAMIQHGLELIQNFLNDYWYTIDFEDMLDELLNYSYENKRKFDMIAAMICAEIGDEDMTGLSPTVLNTIKNQWRDIGYYIDENGYRRWGVIPNDRNWKAN